MGVKHGIPQEFLLHPMQYLSWGGELEHLVSSYSFINILFNSFPSLSRLGYQNK